MTAMHTHLDVSIIVLIAFQYAPRKLFAGLDVTAFGLAAAVKQNFP